MEISMLNTTLTGNITFTEIVEKDDKVANPFLKIVVAVTAVNDNGVTVIVRTKNGLLEAARNGEDLVGTRVVINGTIDLASISSHWMNDEGGLVARKKPQFRLFANSIERMNRKPAPQAIQPELAVG